MADNVAILDGVGASKTVATKDISSVHFQKEIPYDDLGNPCEELPYRHINLSTTGQVVKASAGYLKSLELSNRSDPAVEIFIKVYDKATAPTGSDTPVNTYPVQAGGGTISITYSGAGRKFAAGISLRATTGIADADTGAPGTNAAVVNCGYK